MYNVISQDSIEVPPPRLFQASNASGCFEVQEVVDFSQQDLVTDDVFILDAFDNVYVWVGEDSRSEEKTMAMDTAIVSQAWCVIQIDLVVFSPW